MQKRKEGKFCWTKEAVQKFNTNKAKWEVIKEEEDSIQGLWQCLKKCTMSAIVKREVKTPKRKKIEYKD